ncbi:MAG: endonuclease/exonuclease/phosphatase family protein [Acidobacteria bacterium]|nr:endonuclease/exonuclease/phosphatase family protein [Acidobacteriota bacterium]MBV9474473.1 endonuclease/exonuclease/phosphatase family protein [Acidobacteriota bacterium]
MRLLKRLGVTLLVLVAVFLAYRVLGVYQIRPGKCTAGPPRTIAQTYPKRLVVLTYNIEGHAALLRSDHIARIADVINAVHPDVVGINEAHRKTFQARFADEVEELRRRTHMNGVFGRSYSFMGGAFGNAVLTRGEIVHSEVHPLPGTGEPRTLLETLVRIDGGTVAFMVAHTSAWGGINREQRGEQLACMNSYVRASAFPTILTGDFNAPPESEEIAGFLANNVLQFAGNPATPSHKVLSQRLDYILADRGWKVRDARVLDLGPSDHKPVLAELVHE